ncbi:MAG: glucoamylase family protein [Betaproteobacteria bacterium]
MLSEVQRDAFQYFIEQYNPANGLIADASRPGAPCSIAATGVALACYPIAVERSFLSRTDAVRRVVTTLAFFWNSEQSEAEDATGYRGFYYHFLDMQTGRRVWQSELSTVDSAFLLAGALAAAAYFDQDSEEELQLRTLAEQIYRRADFDWARNGGATLTHGWCPESGFIQYRWEGYDEALLLYVLALGSPAHPIAPESYQAWLTTYDWRTIYGIEHVYAGPLFIHQLSHVWIDFRGIQDAYMRPRNLDYFENSRRATQIHQQYGHENPKQLPGYCALCWGISASDGPGPAVLKIDGVEREFFGYLARGVPFGPDDGTVSPWAAVTSLPFAPEIVLPTLHHFIDKVKLKHKSAYGFEASFNATYPDPSNNAHGWVSPWHFGINQGPIVLMIENYRSELLWRIMRGSEHVVRGLRRCGFTGGWL